MIEDARLRTAYFTQQMDAINRGFKVLSVPVFRHRGNAVTLTAAAKATTKQMVMDTFTDIDAEADKVIALGGVVDVKVQAAQLENPAFAVAFLNDTHKSILGEQDRAEVALQPDGNLANVLTPDMETNIKDDLATLGTVLKMWVLWAKPQAAALEVFVKEQKTK